MISVQRGLARFDPNRSRLRNNTSFDTVATYHVPSFISCSSCVGSHLVVWMKNLKSNPLNGFSSRSSFIAFCAWTGSPPQNKPSAFGSGVQPLTYGQACNMSMAFTPPPLDIVGSSSLLAAMEGDDPAHHNGWIINAASGCGVKPSSSAASSSPADSNKVGGKSPIKLPVRLF